MVNKFGTSSPRSASLDPRAQIVRGAREHHVRVRPVCIHASLWDCSLEPDGDDRFAVRLGMRYVRGLPKDIAAQLIAANTGKPFKSIDDVWRRSGVKQAQLVSKWWQSADFAARLQAKYEKIQAISRTASLPSCDGGFSEARPTRSAFR